MRKTKKIVIHLGLFLLAMVTTTIAGMEHSKYPFTFFNYINGAVHWNYSWDHVWNGLKYSVPFLLILTVHEFGHYFTAMYHKVKSSLPYYIPLWLPGIFAIGTMGAVIRLGKTRSTKQFFDIGVAGPLAGFIVALVVLWYGFTHLPPTQYLLEVNSQYEKVYQKYGEADFANHLIENDKMELANMKRTVLDSLRREGWNEDKIEAVSQQFGAHIYVFGTNLMFEFFKKYVATHPERVPDKYNLLHYPFLFAGYLALFFTALNLMPIGQLDGGHILYGLIGQKRFKIISPVIFTVFVVYAGLGMDYILPSKVDTIQELIINSALYVGFLTIIYRPVFNTFKSRLAIAMAIFSVQFFVGMFFPHIHGYAGFLFFALILSRLLGIYHPPAPHEHKLDTKRKVIGWVSLVIFVLCFSPQPFGSEFIQP